jgi:CheY-like chemotaxis protein
MRILIVDDIFTNRLLLVEIFRTMDIDCDQVSNGKEAIDAHASQDYDLIFMDIEMPVKNGLETTEHIRKKMVHPKNKTAIIALTAHSPELFQDDFRNIGFNRILIKPYTIEKITEILQDLTDWSPPS